MKAAVCYEFGHPLVIEDIEIDPPKQGEVKVRVEACAVCHSDIHRIRGDFGGEVPMVVGHEAAGVVDEVGEGVTGVRPGDRVIVSLLRSCGRCYYCMTGAPNLCEGDFALKHETRLHTKDGTPILQGINCAAFAEYAVVDQSQLVKIPDDLPSDSASLLACGVITGLGAVVNTGKVPAGSSVVVIGVGGVGLNSVQGAHLSGANPIIAVDLLDGKLEDARAFGATHGINARDPEAKEKVRALTGGRGADYAVITVGATAAVEQGLSMIRNGGTVIIAGLPHAEARMPLAVFPVARSGQSILGSFMGSTRLQVDVPHLISLYEEGRLKLGELISARYPLEQINEAIASTESGEARRNVIVFQ